MAITTLTYGLIKTRLQIANCCAGVKGNEILKKQKKGVNCDCELEEAQLVTSIVDSIKSYASVIDSVAAICSYSTSTWTGGGPTFNLSCFFTGFTVGGFSSRTVTGQSSIAGALSALATAINSANGSTIAYVQGTTFVLYAPTAGEAGNDYAITFSASGGGAPNISSPSGTFSGGVDGNFDTEFDDTNTCLTSEQIIQILEKLTTLCPGPCTDYVNFQA